jgi:hypothetical protein
MILVRALTNDVRGGGRHGVCFILVLKGGDGSSSLWLTELAVKAKVPPLAVCTNHALLESCEDEFASRDQPKGRSCFNSVAVKTAMGYPAVQYGVYLD